MFSNSLRRLDLRIASIVRRAKVSVKSLLRHAPFACPRALVSPRLRRWVLPESEHCISKLTFCIALLHMVVGHLIEDAGMSTVH